MTTINKIAEYNTEIYRNMQIKNTERRLDELRLEERRVKHLREVTEQTRIEMNRRMNRPGQNVDRMA
jgi:prephenate dehydrogenase